MPLAGRQFKGVEVAEILYRAGFRGADLVTAVALAYAESRWYEQAWNPEDPHGGSYGLMQINMIHGHTRTQLYDADFNAAAAFRIYTGRGNPSFRPWGAYYTGAYRYYLPLGVAAVARLELRQARQRFKGAPRRWARKREWLRRRGS